MILRAAGGGGVITPLTYGETKRPMPTWMVAAIGVSVAAHVAAGLWLYQQNFVLKAQPAFEESRPTETQILHLPTIEDPAPVPPQDPTVSVRPVDNPAPTAPPAPFPPNTSASTGEGIPIIVTSPTSPAGGGGELITIDPPKAPPVIGSPKWVRMPSADQMERFYPKAAVERELNGSATLRCTVTLEGTLTGCAVQSETPAGVGFGESAVKLSRFFRMSPKTVDGQPVAGAVVTVPIGFRLD